MKIKVYSLLLSGLACMLLLSEVKAQCPAGRYNTMVFDTFTVTTVTYSTVYNLQMDIYQPGLPGQDTLAQRPVIVLAHGGSFISGDRTDDNVIVQLCENFAERGYVTDSIDYRLATNDDSLGAVALDGDTGYMISEVVEAISDGKAAVRYFTKDAYTSNTYKIDTNNIFIGGNSAGSVLYIQVAYIDSLGACPPDLQLYINANGGFEGNSGNPGYPTKFKAVINLAGALNIPSFIGPGSVPSVNAQGSADPIVPYDCGYPNVDGFPVAVRLCGLGVLEGEYESNNIYHSSYVFVGSGHVPWQDTVAYFDIVDSMTTAFLYTLVCNGAEGITNINDNSGIAVFPNPTSDLINIRSVQNINSLRIYDDLGRLMLSNEDVNKTSYQINTSSLSRGTYFIRILSGNNSIPVVKPVIIE